MRQQDFEAFSEVVVGFAELKGRQLSAAAIKLYWNAMQHWELEDFRAAAGELLRRNEFMPTPKDFEDLRRAGRLAAGEAWAYVLRSFPGRTWVNIEPSDEDRALIERAVRALGGWAALGRNSAEQNDRLERRFTEHFEALRDVADVREALPQLAEDPTRPRLNGSPKPVGALLPRRRGDA